MNEELPNAMLEPGFPREISVEMAHTWMVSELSRTRKGH